MHLQESGEMYLETILVLSKSNTNVRSIDVGEHLGYTKPSVSRAIGLLKSAGYVVMEHDGSLKLTEEGRQIAEKIYERHTYLTQFLKELGISAEVAAADACKVEHVISDETFAQIKKNVIEKGL